MNIFPLKYNENITIINMAGKYQEPLPDGYYYALMIEDSKVRMSGRQEWNDNRSFFDIARGWIGLERTSGNRIYISKRLSARKNCDRGATFIVRVIHPGLCCVLD